MIDGELVKWADTAHPTQIELSTASATIADRRREAEEDRRREAEERISEAKNLAAAQASNKPEVCAKN